MILNNPEKKAHYGNVEAKKKKKSRKMRKQLNETEI